jgi:hypothetical protein
MALPPICYLLALLGAGAGAAAAVQPGPDGGHFSGWRVERTVRTQALGDLDPDTVQLVAGLVGPGNFEVRAAPIAEPGVPGRPATVLTFTRPSGAGATAPALRVLVGGTTHRWWVRAGPDSALVSGFLQARGAALDGRAAGELMPRLLTATLYGGQAELVSAQPVAAGASGRLAWRGRFQRPDGSADQVTVVLPVRAEGLVELQRTVAAPADRASPAPSDPDEEWTLVQVQGWKPDRRYKPMLAMAILGQTQMKFRLANALLETGEPASIAEGLKWLNSAAADGSRPAVERLATACAAPIRPSRERDGVRMDWCDCFLLKKAVAANR